MATFDFLKDSSISSSRCRPEEVQRLDETGKCTHQSSVAHVLLDSGALQLIVRWAVHRRKQKQPCMQAQFIGDNMRHGKMQMTGKKNW